MWPLGRQTMRRRHLASSECRSLNVASRETNDEKGGEVLHPLTRVEVKDLALRAERGAVQRRGLLPWFC